MTNGRLSHTKFHRKRHENVFLCFLCKYFSLISTSNDIYGRYRAYDILIHCLRNMNQLKFSHIKLKIFDDQKLWRKGVANNNLNMHDNWKL